VKPRWRFHAAGGIECLDHSPGVITYAGTCPECDRDRGRTNREKYPGVGCAPDPYDPTSERPTLPSGPIPTERID